GAAARRAHGERTRPRQDAAAPAAERQAAQARVVWRAVVAVLARDAPDDAGPGRRVRCATGEMGAQVGARPTFLESLHFSAELPIATLPGGRLAGTSRERWRERPGGGGGGDRRRLARRARAGRSARAHRHARGVRL